MFVLFFLFIFDMIVGILTDMIVNRKRLSKKKFTFAFVSFAIYTTIIAMIYTVGEHMDDLNEALVIDNLRGKNIYAHTNIYAHINIFFANSLGTFCTSLFQIGKTLMNITGFLPATLAGLDATGKGICNNKSCDDGI